jgi:hypothetical protein
MTVEVAQRRTRKPKVLTASESLAIGEIDQTVFACPACARPLALGARHCPGCGTHLILGVQAKRASIFVVGGLAAGVVLAGMLGAAGSAIDKAARDATAAAAAAAVPSGFTPVASVSPSPTADPAPTTPGTGTDSSVPGLTRSALAQAAAVDDRLAASSTALTAALSAPKFDTYGLSQILRATSAEAVLGLQLSSYVGTWPRGHALSGEMTSFYTTVQQTAAEGLSASIRNEKAYRTAGLKMLDLLRGLDLVDGHVRDLAADAGVVIAPAP